MKLKYKYIIFILSFILCLIFFYGKILILDLLFYTGNEDLSKYIGSYEKEITYNRALTLSQTGKILEGRKAIETILNDPISGKEADIYELYGDILATSSGKLDDIRDYYNLALEYGRRDRVTEKIRLLNIIPEVKKNKEPKEKEEKKQLQKEIEFSNEEEGSLEKKRAEIRKLESDRGKYLSPVSPQIQKNIIRETIDFLDTGKEVVDW